MYCLLMIGPWFSTKLYSLYAIAWVKGALHPRFILIYLGGALHPRFILGVHLYPLDTGLYPLETSEVHEIIKNLKINQL